MLAVLCGLLAGTANVQAAWLPDPVPGVMGNSLEYGNFYVYSLAYLSNIASKQPGYTQNSDPFIVKSTPGAIKDDVVVATGAAGNPVNTNFSGMDNAYSTPSGASGSPYFQTSDSEPAPNDGSSWDTVGKWNSSIDAMRSYLGDQEFVFYFNLNQENSGDNVAGLARAQDLLAWARISLEDSTGVNDAIHFYVSEVITSPPADPGKVAPDTSVSVDGPVANPAAPGFDNTDPKWAYVHGAIAVDPVTGFFVDYGPGGPGLDTINQNLGADQAAFALYNPLLSSLIKNSDMYDRISWDIKFSGLNNGYEQVFVLATTVGGPPPPPIPEPASVVCWALLGCCVMGAPLYRKVRARCAR